MKKMYTKAWNTCTKMSQVLEFESACRSWYTSFVSCKIPSIFNVVAANTNTLESACKCSVCSAD